jgi:hypothetical protein
MREKHGGWVFRGSADARAGGESAELMAEELKLLDGRKGEKLMKDECAQHHVANISTEANWREKDGRMESKNMEESEDDHVSAEESDGKGEFTSGRVFGREQD